MPGFFVLHSHARVMIDARSAWLWQKDYSSQIDVYHSHSHSTFEEESE